MPTLGFRLLVMIVWVATVAVAQAKTIHVYVALADNRHQLISPVPGRLGDGDRRQSRA